MINQVEPYKVRAYVAGLIDNISHIDIEFILMTWQWCVALTLNESNLKLLFTIESYDKMGALHGIAKDVLNYRNPLWC